MCINEEISKKINNKLQDLLSENLMFTHLCSIRGQFSIIYLIMCLVIYLFIVRMIISTDEMGGILALRTLECMCKSTRRYSQKTNIYMLNCSRCYCLGDL